VSEALLRGAEVAVRFGQVRLDLERQAITRHGVVKLPSVLQGNGQIAVRLGVPGQEFHRLAQGGQGVFALRLERNAQGLPGNCRTRVLFHQQLRPGLQFRKPRGIEQRDQPIDFLRR